MLLHGNRHENRKKGNSLKILTSLYHVVVMLLHTCRYNDLGRCKGWGEKQIRSVESARSSVGRSLEGRGVESVAWGVRAVKWLQCICSQQRQQREAAYTEEQTGCLVPVKPFTAKMLLSLPQLPPVADCSFGISQARVLLFSICCSSSCGAGSVGEDGNWTCLASLSWGF